MLRYFEAFTGRFTLRELITFRKEVQEIAPAEGGGWLVRLTDGTQGHYRAVIVANGHLWKPRLPDFAGRFDGEIGHSHHYRTPEPFIGKDVLIVGIGNSAVDIAVDVARVARSLHLSTRRSAWVLPKYLLGVPVDRWGTFLVGKLRLSVPLSRAIVGRAARFLTGRQERIGLPRPALRSGANTPRSARICCPISVMAGSRSARTSRRCAAQEVLFAIEDGKKVRLYRRMRPPDQPGLYFAGFVQPIGPTIPLVEKQARWLADVLSARVTLPGREVMEREIEQHHRHLTQRYVGSARYTLEVDFRSYSKQLAGDREQGAAGA